MCTEYERNVPITEIEREFERLKIPLRWPKPNLADTNIKITETGTIVCASSEEPGAAELAQRRWSWPSPNGPPVFNFRSDGRDFTNGRCLIVTSGFYEFTDVTPEEGAPKSREEAALDFHQTR